MNSNAVNDGQESDRSANSDSNKSSRSDSEEKYDDASADVPPEGQTPDLHEAEVKNAGENESCAKTQRIEEDIEANEDDLRLKAMNEEDHQTCELCKYFYVIGDAAYVVHARDPWPKDVKLFQPHQDKQILLSENANCLTVQTFLKMCNLDFQIDSRPNAEYMSPTGKVPFIKCGPLLVAELEGIVAFVAQKGICLTKHLNCEQKADLRAYETLINSVLGCAENYVSWCDRKTYQEVTKPRNGSVYPWPLNLTQTWSKRSKHIKILKTLGWYRKTFEEVLQEVERCCQALTDRLENDMYFFGNKFTELDALLYGHIRSLLTASLSSRHDDFLGVLSNFSKLMRHYKRIDATVMNCKSDFPSELAVKDGVSNSLGTTNLLRDEKFEGYNDFIGDAGRDTDWQLLNEKADVHVIGDTVVSS